MLLGSAMLICVHFIYAIPDINYWLVAIVLMIILGIAFSLVPSAMWPAVAKIFPVSQLGTAYALIFFIQNIGLWGIPTLIGWVLVPIVYPARNQMERICMTIRCLCAFYRYCLGFVL